MQFPPPPPFLTVWRATSGTGSVKKSLSKELTGEFLTTKFKKLSCGSLLSVGSGGGGGGGIKKCNVPMKA